MGFLRFPPFEPDKIFAVLSENDVDYILIGGLAATAWQSPYSTRDINICPDLRTPNLVRLAAALMQLQAKPVADRHRVALDGPITPDFLAADNERRFSTPTGPVDTVLVPTGTRGYEDLKRQASSEVVFDKPMIDRRN